ncbi:MAG: hypothetical protein COU27_00760, partial [Candidatus Levybacteria bacterium CG10_big_fil_rev_8_21_14_0_10_36_7]
MIYAVGLYTDRGKSEHPSPFIALVVVMDNIHRFSSDRKVGKVPQRQYYFAYCKRKVKSVRVFEKATALSAGRPDGVVNPTWCKAAPR